MSERDELADLYADILFRRHGIETSQSKDVADELIAAGYRKPRTVTTAAELDALPVGSVVLDNDGDVWQKRGEWWCSYESAEMTGTRVRKFGPLTVLHEAVAR